GNCCRKAFHGVSPSPFELAIVMRVAWRRRRPNEQKQAQMSGIDCKAGAPRSPIEVIRETAACQNVLRRATHRLARATHFYENCISCNFTEAMPWRSEFTRSCVGVKWAASVFPSIVKKPLKCNYL